MHPVFTIGHSTHPVDVFVSLLERNGVTAIADVRSSPASRFNPQFNRAALERSLRERSIQYVFLGRELGARSEDPSCYENGQVQYARLARTELFAQGIDRAIEGASRYRLALMCAEKDPLDCHRTLLVAEALVERGILVEHIFANGTRETHAETLERLVGSQQELLADPEQLRAEAIRRQVERIAYVDESLVAGMAAETQ